MKTIWAVFPTHYPGLSIRKLPALLPALVRLRQEAQYGAGQAAEAFLDCFGPLYLWGRDSLVFPRSST